MCAASVAVIRHVVPLRLDPVLEAQAYELSNFTPLKRIAKLSMKDHELKRSSLNKSSETFRRSIQALINKTESHPPKDYHIPSICSSCGFQKRRFYDVINVLEAVGACWKKSVDVIVWKGLAQIPETLRLLQYHSATNGVNSTMEDIFPNEKCISISHLTVSLVLFFFALRKRSLHIKQVGIFLSRHNGRYKTTLCKLYQITHILEAAGIIEKSVIPGEIMMVKEFYAPVEFEREEKPVDLFSITSLLNSSSDDDSMDSIIEQRRYEFNYQFRKLRSKFIGSDSNSDQE